MRRFFLTALIACTSPAAFAADAQLTLELPKMDVSEYHRPYVAIWVEREDRSVAANLAVWYQDKDGKDAKSGKAEPGTKWLSDLRQWWRRSGREQTMPIDGVSGATRPAGQYQLAFSGAKAPFAGLAAGNYKLVVEVAREVGGHELVSVPFAWPPTAPQHLAAKGESEIGDVKFDLNP